MHMKDDIDLALVLAMLRKAAVVALRRSAIRVVGQSARGGGRRGASPSHDATRAAS
jgi:hypothetical protein